MTKLSRSRALFGAGLVCVGALACSSSGSPGPAAASGAAFLSGTYRAVNAGPIAEITFYGDSRYMLVDGACADALLGTAADEAAGATPPSLAACNELGTYALDAAGTMLTLSPTGKASRQIPFASALAGAAYAARASSLAPPELRVQGGSLTSGTDASLTSGSDAGLTAGDGGVLVPCPGGTLSKSGVPLTQAFSAGNQQLVGGNPPSGTPDPTQGGQWSCDGSFDGFISNAYYVTTFGCSSKSPAFQDPDDNCCGAGATVAASQGLCGTLKPASTCSNACGDDSSCNSWRADQSGAIAASFKCEEQVNYYSTGAVSYGIGTRICLSTPAGKGIVVFVYDDGPACSIETRVSAHVLDVSPPTAQYLFGESQVSAPERLAVFVTTVSQSTPLGPNNGCASAAPTGAGADSGAGGGGGGGGGDAGGGAANGDAGKSCIPSTPCTSDATCNPSGPLGLACVSGTCQPGCHTSAQCASGTTCSGASGGGLGSCQAGGSGKSCSNDGACNPGGNGTGMICSGGTCTAGCRASWQCPGNTSCHGGQCS
jgi:hypothetical protein